MEGSIRRTYGRDLLNCLLPSLDVASRLYGFGTLLNMILQPINAADQQWGLLRLSAKSYVKQNRSFLLDTAYSGVIRPPIPI
ncbi:hypothetical protein ACGYK3_17095 [Sulfitobacter sp. 1A05707]|uniref:hypothetical protein n=1 Tax=unclassified Sulfitobacter TaxID=196795 RepID=UPI0012E8611F|nr:hypothetical protein [Sulfitobacter sp. HI0054]